MGLEWQLPDHLELSPEEMRARIIEAQGFSARVGTLSEIALEIDAADSKESMLRVLREDAKWLIDHECCFLCLVNTNRTHYTVNTLSAIADSLELNHKVFSLEIGMPGWVIANQTPIIVDIESSPAFTPSLEGKLVAAGIKSLLIVPMKTGRETIGSICFGSARQNAYLEPDLWIAQLLSLQAAVSLENLMKIDRAKKRISQIELVNKVAASLTATLELDEMLTSAATIIQKSFSYFDVSIFLLNSDANELELIAHAGNFIDFLPHGFRQKITQGIIGWVAQHGERILANDTSQEPRYLAFGYHNTNSELALPIKMNDAIVGVLNVEDVKLHAFDETDAIVLQNLCDQIASVIRNARLFEEVRKVNTRLTEMDKLKSEFVGIVSHDFRTPLSSIMLAARSLIKREPFTTNENLKEYLSIIIDQTQKLSQLAEDTLSITKIESGQLSYYFKIVNVERLIKDAISLVRFSPRHNIEIAIDPNVPYVKGDQNKLRQVVQNLISNAVKYSPRGGKVTVRVEDQSDEHVLFSIGDEGIGIAPENIDRLFKKFSRIETAETSDIKGSGLGLWICHEIVRAHGGRIWVDSKPAKGSIFCFTLKKAGN